MSAYGMDDATYSVGNIWAAQGSDPVKTARGFVGGLIDPTISDTSLQRGLPSKIVGDWSNTPGAVVAKVAGAQAGIALQVGVLSGLVALLAVKASGTPDAVPQAVFMFGMMSGLGGEVVRELISDWQNKYVQAVWKQYA